MADNTILPGIPSTGDTVRSEDVGGSVKVLATKIHLGIAGQDTGPVTSTNPLPASISSDVGSSNTFGQTTVGTTAVVVTSLTLPPVTRGVTVKALNSNTGTVYVGNNSNVSATTGFELGAGESVSLPVNQFQPGLRDRLGGESEH